MAPAICVTFPVPSHSGHTVDRAAEVPLPPQVSQISWRVIFELDLRTANGLPEVDG